MKFLKKFVECLRNRVYVEKLHLFPPQERTLIIEKKQNLENGSFVPSVGITRRGRRGK